MKTASEFLQSLIYENHEGSDLHHLSMQIEIAKLAQLEEQTELMRHMSGMSRHDNDPE